MFTIALLVAALMWQEPWGFQLDHSMERILISAVHEAVQPNVTTKESLAAYMKSVPSPPKLTPSFVSANDETKLRWVLELIDWTETLIGSSYDQGTFRLDEEARGYMLSLLTQYYTPEQAEQLLSWKYRKTSFGAYEYLESERLSRIEIIDRDREVTTIEHPDSYEIVVTGSIMEQLNETEWFPDPVEEHFFFDKRDLRISEMRVVRN